MHNFLKAKHLLEKIIKVPFSLYEIELYSNDDLRRIRMVNYISLISMFTMLSYVFFYNLLDYSLFKPAIVFLSIGSILTGFITLLNNNKLYNLSKILLASINPFLMFIISLVFFGETPGFEAFLLVAAIIPLFLWSVKQAGYLVFFITLDVLLYFFLKFFRPDLPILIEIPQNYIILFQSTSVFFCFVAAGMAVSVHLVLSYKREKILILQTKELERAQQHRDIVYSIIAHDLSSSLNGQQQLTKLLINDFEDYSDDKKKYYLNTIYNSNISLLRLFKNLLEWSKFQSGKFDQNFIEFDLVKAINDVQDQLNERISAKQLTLSNEVNEGSLVKADYQMVLTVIRNLISNAIKYSDAGSRIDVTSKRENGYHNIRIRDFGVGISNNGRAKIFDLNSVYTTLGTNKEKGNGFGLKICKDFIQANGGKIWLESQEGIGSNFYFSLPSAE